MDDSQMRPDIAAAWATVPVKSGRRRDVRKLPGYLNHGESVVAMTGGVVGTNAGLLVATNRRVLFVSEGLINNSFEDFPYDRISSVTSTRGMMLAKIMINTGGSNRVIKKVQKAEAESIASAIRDRVETVTRARASRSEAPSIASHDLVPSLASQLRDLAELREQGVLTHDEFETQKARLLSQ